MPLVKQPKDHVSVRSSPVEKIAVRREQNTSRNSSIRVISGEENSTYSRTLDSLSEILSHRQMRLQPIASQGPVQDLVSVLHRSDIDTAIVQADALEGAAGHVQSAVRERLRYLFQVSSKAVHVLAPRHIADIRQLEGRKVNINRPGSGAHLTASLMFEKLGIKPEFTTYDQDTAFQRLQSGEIHASILLASNPSTEVLAFPSSGRFHLLPIVLEEGASHYRSVQLTADEYPHLIETGQQVETIAVGHILVVRDWPEGSSRYKRLTHLAEVIDAHLDELKQTEQDLQRTEINLQAAPGWQRFDPAQSLIHKRARQADEQRAFERLIVASGVCSTPISTAVRERLYQDFIDWRRARERNTRSPTSGSDFQ
ncbi:TAXI family TRAP transporter solute-binding subunit [Microvirga sp. KLBC 81]|uniref:TAXI family TRAP transporter solute-binding subunit n=1 Tax=Microvirga sp. KLBC 81 TaxID=1862707 RepID=UPI001402062C|nr:TAXI family TRAP transporter solute-binding subunit [Microvirga sp. KLBC 81]